MVKIAALLLLSPSTQECKQPGRLVEPSYVLARTPEMLFSKMVILLVDQLIVKVNTAGYLRVGVEIRGGEANATVL